ncbi:hypothetical protein GN958_ATG01880 [Phytophthora infestans]|uniref:RNase III domain-containing protein n=1 Tax=Phytophthora infestans TaxID=4787 RepID=A0A8S9VC36_PHYIN|nr:hypothetical protein GN958_ATG01880 [Phytophthora infestans]KAI9983419.1 hypothetical protein PInf_007443 [Phytophthora infestans]
MTKKRRNGHTRRRSFSESDVQARVKKAKHNKEDISVSTSAAAVAHFHALQSCSSSAALADVFEWLGDAVIGELVGRCLLSQFHQAPLSARVFRNLRLAVVTNRNLAQVYGAMGYAVVQRRNLQEDASWKKVKLKQRADVVEAVVGELVLKLHQRKDDADGYRAHLDTVLASMLHCHFTERSQAAKEKGETVMAAKGPLSVAFNPFACLPEEQLDETTGELIVTKGVDIFEADEEEKSSVDEYEYEAVGSKDSTTPHHYFAVGNDTIKEDTIRVAMKQLDREHILRRSREIFEVFKVYGMAVLSERLSLSLALPHVSLRLNKQSEMVTPARLTRQRQRVLSVANLAKCAVSLGIAELIQGNEHEAARLQEEYGLANTLRAFVGFHSAVATTSTPSNRPSNVLVNVICTTLYDVAFSGDNDFNASIKPCKIPEREPLVAMMQSVGEARVFMNSKACDELHAPGERPVSNAALERRRQPSLLLRQCIDSTRLETLFETLNKEQEAQRQRSEAAPSLRKRRPKKKKTVDGFAATAGCVTRNLERFLHRRFLFCLEEIVVLFAQRKTEACRAQIAVFEHDLEPCAELPHFRKWEVSTSTLTLAMRDSFFRMLLHDVCQFHAVISTSRNARDGTRITQLRLPLHYTWSNIDTRITTEQQARS